MKRTEFDANLALAERADTKGAAKWDSEDAPMGVFIGLRNAAVILIVAIAAAWILAAL